MIVSSNGVDIRTLETPHTLFILVTEVHAQKQQQQKKLKKTYTQTIPPKPAL